MDRYNALLYSIDPEPYDLHLQNHLSFAPVRSAGSLHPLPIIFFDQASSTIPQRYDLCRTQSCADDYREERPVAVTYTVTDETNTKYYEVLNIIGARLRRADTLTIELQGGYSAESGEDPAIARERAEIVASYLTDVWRIDPSLISLLPPRRYSDSTDHDLAHEEARSVRIYPNHYALLSEVHYGVDRITSTRIACSIHLRPNMEMEEVTEIRLIASSGGDILGITSLPLPEFSDQSEQREWKALWEIPRRVTEIDEAITFQVVIDTRNGRWRGSNVVTIPVAVNDVIDAPWNPVDTALGWSPFSSEEEELRVQRLVEITEKGNIFPWDLRQSISDTIRYFNLRDTRLNELQMRELERVIERFSIWLERIPGKRWRVRVEAGGDLGEAPEVDHVWLETQHHLYHKTRTFDQSMLDRPDHQTSMIIIPERVLAGDTLSREELRELVIATYRDDGSRSEAKDDTDDSDYLYRTAPPLSYNVELFDSLLIERSEEVAACLWSRLPGDSIDAIRADIDHPTHIFFLPEDRFYERTVVVSLYCEESNPWNEDEFKEYAKAEAIYSEDTSEGSD